jgi:hypothetical protein
MSLASQVSALATRVGVEIKAVHEALDASGVAVQPTEPPTSMLWVDTDEESISGPSWVVLTQSAYDALAPPDPDILYVVIG